MYTYSGQVLSSETEKQGSLGVRLCISHILVVPFWIWSSFKDGLVLSLPQKWKELEEEAHLATV